MKYSKYSVNNLVKENIWDIHFDTQYLLLQQSKSLCWVIYFLTKCILFRGNIVILILAYDVSSSTFSLINSLEGKFENS